MSTDRDYFLRRAEEEEAKAARCDNEFAQEAHERLAEIYREAARGTGPKPLRDYQIGSSELFIL